MATSIDVPISIFFNLIEEDKNFFNYFDVSDEDAMELATKRAKNYLNEAVAKVTLQCNPTVDFTDRDESGNFNFDWTPTEKLLIPSLMYEQYLERDIAYLRKLQVNYAPKEVRVFDPSNARSTFLDLLKHVHDQNEYYMDVYKNTDRITGDFVSINFAKYDEENS